MGKHVVCRVEELPPGAQRVVNVDGRAILVLNAGGAYRAVRDSCPHQGAPLSAGTVGGTMVPSAPHEYVYGLEGCIIRCPWHGLEFDLATGRSLADPDRLRVKVYSLTVDSGALVLES